MKSQLPIPPQMKLRPSDKKDVPSKSEGGASIDDFVMLSSEDCLPLLTLEQDSTGIFGQLYADLLSQLKVTKLQMDIFTRNRICCLTINRCALIIASITN